MRADFAVLLDANVIATFGVFDLFMRLSEDPRLLLPKWTHQILDEAKRTYTHKLKHKWEPARVDRMFTEAKRAFPEAWITGHEPLIPCCSNHERDRHVLAAAIKGQVQTIVTFNLRDFREGDLSPWDVVAAHPGEYLVTLFGHSPGIVVDRLNDIASVRQMRVEDIVSRLGRNVPSFALHIGGELGWDINQASWK